MKNYGKTVKKKLDQLREKTNEALKNYDSQQAEHLSETDARKLIEELHLYQVKLEMQNEQLRAVSEELATAVTKYEDLYDFAPVGYVTLDEFGTILEANLTSSRLLGTDRHMLIKSRFSRFAAPESFDSFTSFLQSTRNSDTKQTCELTFIRPDHTVFEARMEAIAFLARTPQQMQFRVAIIDISEQKAAERRTRESQEFVKKIADTMPDILTVYDVENRKNLYGNREIQTLLGLSPEKIRQDSPEYLLTLVHPDDIANLQQNMMATRNLHDGEVSEFEYRIRNKAGKYIWLRVRSVVFQRNAKGGVSQVLSVQQDVSYQKEAERELRFKTEIINGLQSNLPIVVSIIQPDGTFEAITGSGLRSVKEEGFPDLQGQNIFELFPDLRPQIESVFKTGIKVSYVYCLGKEQKTCFQNYVFLDHAQNAAIAFSIDISEQTAAERNIIAEREFSQSLLNNSVDGILAFDNELRFTAWNKVMEQHSGLSKDDILGKKIFDLFPFFTDTISGQALKKVQQGERVILYDLDLNVKNTLFEAYLNPLFNDAGKVTGGLCILHNIREQKKLQEESTRLKLEQQKEIMNAVLVTQEEERRRIAESLHNGLGQLLYAAKLNLERNYLTNPESIKLQTELLDEAIRETRTISFELMPRILEDFGLETALHELLKRITPTGIDINLYSTGLKRLPENIEIAVYRIIQELINNILKHSQATIANLEVVCRNKVLQFMAKDNGVGFEPNEKISKTKGIGLTGIRNRVKLLDGKMTIESEPGKGTTVSIELKV